jgi:hypothetical protein
MPPLPPSHTASPDYMVPRMLGLDDLDQRALPMAMKCSGSGATGMRMAVQGESRSRVVGILCSALHFLGECRPSPG